MFCVALALVLPLNALQEQVPPPPHVLRAHLGAEGPSGSWTALARAVEGAGARLSWHPNSQQFAAGSSSCALFVQTGSGPIRVTGPSTPARPFAPVASEVGVGDLVLLRPGAELHSDVPLGVLVFARDPAWDETLPTVIRPDFDPRITDTPGGCATEAGAYRRICLTWEGRNGPYLDQHLNAHRVRIRDSFTHYHPVAGGFDELYLVQDVLPGAALIAGENLPAILDPEHPDATNPQQLVRTLELRAGDLVFLPRGTAHRGLGGVLAQVITLPGFVPGAEIGLDHALAEINRRHGTALPVHQPGLPFVAMIPQSDRVRIEVGDQMRADFLHFFRNRPCIYPLRTASGRNLLRQFPFADAAQGEAEDHPHHTGIWFAHGQVDGVDFWHDPAARQVLLGIDEFSSRPGVGSFRARIRWLAPDGRPLLDESRHFHWRVVDDHDQLDFTSTLRAIPEAVRFGDTKEGTFALRLAAPLRVEGPVATGFLCNAAGLQGRAAWGKRAPWLSIGGRLLDGEPAGIALLEHPLSFRAPTWWHARTYGLIAANPFGAHDFEGGPHNRGDFVLQRGQEISLRYRMLLADRHFTAAEINASMKAYTALR